MNRRNENTEKIYRDKKQEVISKFSEKLTTKDFEYNPTFHKIVACLIMGHDPYSIIEQLLINQEQLIKEMHQMQQRGRVFRTFTNPELGEPYEK